MRFAHLLLSSDTAPTLVVVRGDRYIPVAELGLEVERLQRLVERGPGALRELREALEDYEGGEPLPQGALAPAVIRPPIVLAVGLNYGEHASELDLDNGAEPVLFTLFPNSLNGHNCDVPLPMRLSHEVDYEGELGVVIGKAAKNVTPEEALDYVFGYTVINDITARNIQFQEPQWSRCKSFDGFTPIGPWVVTADEIPDPQQLRITTELDGTLVQNASTGEMIRSVAELVSMLSQSLTLLPGTVISTGSPGGAGKSRFPPLYLKPGSEVTVTIDGIGSLTNRCVAD